MLPRHARCVLSRLRFNGHSLLLGSISLELAVSRILPAAPVDTSHLVLHCPATESLGVTRLLGLHGLPPSLGKGRVTNNNVPANLN